MPQHVHKRFRGDVTMWRRVWQCAPIACALAAGVALSRTCAAAEIEIAGTGTFKRPSSDRLAAVPTGAVFSRDDLSSGTWAFRLRYEDSTRDIDRDPYVGRYGEAIRAVELTVGSTTIALPLDNAELIVSDGGLGFPDRESIRVKSWLATPAGVLRFSWVQSNQAKHQMDLRGAPGSLASDALPNPAALANLPISSRFDRFMTLELSTPAAMQPLLYVSSSQVSVAVHAAAAQ